MVASKRFKLNKEDGQKVLKGAGIAMGGALVVYLIEIIPQVEFGEVWTPLVVAVTSVTLNFVRKWLQGK